MGEGVVKGGGDLSASGKTDFDILSGFEKSKDPLQGLSEKQKIDGALDLIARGKNGGVNGSQASVIVKDTESFTAKKRMSVVDQIMSETQRA